ncbi:MAG: DUF2189 domain-containing protein [Rhodoferax sp.]|uniref:DUF2189 domain-containing protein n=1 Tax=Rhodoferax sp. TaxID=50421 RepID=UPI0026183D02|nr:DUF2189 domain-containing protein [Rhodoferax sp.]MDD2880476.1 DUF2189 domain-containing protein [Rhodoferax sp.]
MSNFQDEVPPPLYVPPPSEAPPKEVISLTWSAPPRWLGLGWRDLTANPGVSLFYGLAFWGMAVLLGVVFRTQTEYTMMMASGCLLLGPFLAMGLYEVSRRRELGLPADFARSMTCWRSHLRSMGLLVGVLIVLELLWGRASLVVIAVFFNAGLPSSIGAAQAVFNPDNWEFVLVYTLVGGAFAALVFAISVVSIPMILDHDTDAITAAIGSIEVVVTHPGVMLLWGALITALVTVALLLPWAVGLLLMGPLLGHATWHAYRGSVRWL